MSCVAGILAGGVGSRMSSKLPKQFIEINGKPVIIRTIEKFANLNKFDKIYIAMNKDWMDYCENLFDKYNVDMRILK